MEDVQTKRPPSKIPMIALVVVILIAIALAIALGVVVSQNNAANQAVVDNSNTDGQSQGTDSPTTSASKCESNILTILVDQYRGLHTIGYLETGKILMYAILLDLLIFK